MQMQTTLKWVCTLGLGLLLVVSLGINLGVIFGRRNTGKPPRTPLAAAAAAVTDKKGDEQLAYLLVKLELATRGEIGAHFTRRQSAVPGVDKLYQRLLVKNLILPAAVADNVFSETVPAATGGRAWVKMIVDQPRNPNNRGDGVATSLLEELRQGVPSAERTTDQACYYAEPIVAKQVCLFCHGSPQGAPDPYFREFHKEGWSAGDIIGAVVARVAPEEASGAGRVPGS